MNQKIRDYLKLVVRTLRDLADVIEAVAEEKVTPATLEKAAACGVGVVSIELDSVLSFIAGIRKRSFAQRPMEMIQDIQSEMVDAVEEIAAKQAK